MLKDRHHRSAIGLAEALQVCSVLGVREGTEAQWLAECLGFLWKESAAEQEKTQPSISPNPQALPETPTTGVNPNLETKKLKLLDSVGQEPMAFETVFEGHTTKIRNAVEIEPASLARSEERPAFQPLFLDRWFQGIFTAVLGIRVPSQEIDYRKLERYVIQGEFFTQLPLKARTKLVKGVHVLLDRSESMQPFGRDQVELLARLRRMLGGALVQHSWFEYESSAARIIWRTSRPGQFRMETPVLIVTDFGNGSDPLGARTMDWEPWWPIFDQARCSRSRILALIACSPGFWPPGINTFVDCSLVWDRDTSPQTAARLCRT